MPKTKTITASIPYHDSPEGLEIARQLAAARELSVSGLLRALVREEARRATRREKREDR